MRDTHSQFSPSVATSYHHANLASIVKWNQVIGGNKWTVRLLFYHLR